MDFLDDLALDALRTPGVPATVIGVLVDGSESYAARGIRSVEDPVAVSEDTLFRVGSISKLLTATTLFRLGVDPGSAVRDHLPDFAVADADVSARLTVRDLLTHRGGFADTAHGRPVTELGGDAVARAVAEMVRTPQVFPLRRFYGYNNSAFIVLARIIEVLAGEPYEAAVARLVFGPAGMARSTFFTEDAITRPVALGHTGSPATVVRPWGRSRARAAAGGLLSSARDLIAFCRQLLADPVAHRMWEPMDEAVAVATGIGYGWNIDELPSGLRRVGHEGITAGYSAALTIIPERGSAFVALVNSDVFHPMIGDLNRAALPGILGSAVEAPRRADDHPETRIDDYVGRNEGIDVHRVGDGVVLSGAESMRVRFTGPDEGLGDERALVRFLREDGVVTWMRIDGEIVARR